MSTENVWRWYGAMGVEPESFQYSADSREAILADLRAMADGETFTICEARKGSMRPWLPNANELISEMFERANDDGAFGEDGDGEILGDEAKITAAEQELDVFLAGWFELHRAIFPTPWLFAEVRSTETFNPPEPAAEGGAS